MDMLVVKRPDKPDHGRLSCTEVYSKLFNLHRKCKDDRDFASKPCRWTRRPSDVENQSEAVEVNLSDSMAQILKPRLSELQVHEGRYTLLSDSPAVLGCRELLAESHSGSGVEAVPRAAVKGMQVVMQQRKSREMGRNCVSSFTTPF